jgi:hypothetical protein
MVHEKVKPKSKEEAEEKFPIHENTKNTVDKTKVTQK